MNRAEMLTELQSVLNSEGASIGAWGELTLLGYLSEGQDRFCEETGFFRDIANYTLTLQTGVAVYALPARTIQLMDIWDGAIRLGKILSDSVTYPDEWPTDFNTNSAGRPTQWQADRTTGYIKLTPTPTAAHNGVIFTLHVWRYSRYDLAGDGAVAGTPAAPEIPSRFQRACIEWAAYKALNHHDMEAQDPVKARDHYQAFQMYVKDGVRQMRRYHNQETRVGADQAYRT